MMRKMMKHQRLALRYGLTRNEWGLLAVAGSAKTLVAIRWAKQKPKTLVVCRPDDYLTWHDELIHEQVNPLDVHFIEKNFVKRKTGQFLVFPWTVCTYGQLKNKQFSKLVRETHFDTIIADESHSIKRWQSIRTKTAYKTTRHIVRRMIMTGTFITNEIMDAWSQLYFMDDGKTLGESEYWFKKSYYIQDTHRWYPKRGGKERLAKKCAESCFVIREEDADMQLPPRRYVTKSCVMSGKQRRHYETILKEFEIRLKEKEPVEIDYVTVQLQKLRQVASGFIYDESGKAIWLQSTKLKLLLDLYQDPDYLGLRTKLVTWCAHTAEITKIASELQNIGDRVVTFYGSDRTKKEKARKRFRDASRVRHFVGQVDSGVGMNELIVARDASYFSNSHRAVSREQSERRIRRKGSEIHDSITYWDLITQHTVDERVRKNLIDMQDTAQYVMDRIRKGYSIRNILKGAA